MSEFSVKILVRRSKTDQLRKGSELMLHGCGIPLICPVALLRDYIKKRPAVGGQFCYTQ